MTKDEALKLALEALEWNMDYLPSQGRGTSMARNAITAIKQALLTATPLAAPVQEKQMNDEKLLRLALEAIERGVRDGYWNKDTVDVSAAIQKRLLQTTPPATPVQEPHCYMDEYGNVEGEIKRYMEEEGGWFPVYITPPAAQRQWVGLTNQELVDLTSIYSGAPLYCAIEAKLKEKNA